MGKHGRASAGAALIDPARLLESAARLFGDDMGRLWGEVLAVPRERLRLLRGGEVVGPFQVAYTPGHASHHVSYLHEPTGCVFTGDVTGVRIADGSVLAPTPPPDVDLVAWRASLERLEAWRPRSFALTHFGAYADVESHLAAMRRQLDDLESMTGELDEERFVAAIRARFAGSTPPDARGAYEQAMPPALSFRGLSRSLSRARSG